ncbi:MAG: hypothetical protein KBD51_03200 [Candidatus Levybacteria bacterium]|nr:hypothetical protein [Candidatus Levybacteria bacterium]
MPTTLSKFKSQFLVVAKWAAIVIGILIGIFVLIKVFFIIKEIISPTPPPPPTVSFGKLPPIFFPESINKKFTYSVDTLSGELPSLPDRTKVYEMEKPGPDLLAVQRANEKVSSLGFNNKPEQLSDIQYRWTSPGPPAKSLVLNVNMASFTLYSPFLSDPTVLSGATLGNQEDALSTAKTFLNALGLYPEDIDDEKTEVELFSINNEVLGPAESLSRAKLISVSYFQTDKDEVKMVYPGGTNSPMNLVIGAGEREPQVVNARFFYQRSTEESGTYPIKTAEEAFEELKNGKGRVVNQTGDNLEIVIKNVYLGLYSEGKQQEYLMPVIVFEGNNNFMAYVSAVKDEWIEK